MRFSCDECGRSYVASDDVAGRAFRMRCKQCGSEVVVRPPSTAPSSFPVAPATASPPPAAAPAPASRPERAQGSPRRTFDPFEDADLPDGDLAVGAEALEILERTPSPRPIPRQAPPSTVSPARTPSPANPARVPPPPAAPSPRRRPGRMLPAEDEAMLGPPGSEDRRAVPRWALIVVAAAALAAAAGFALLR